MESGDHGICSVSLWRFARSSYDEKCSFLDLKGKTTKFVCFSTPNLIEFETNHRLNPHNRPKVNNAFIYYFLVMDVVKFILSVFELDYCNGREILEAESNGSCEGISEVEVVLQGEG